MMQPKSRVGYRKANKRERERRGGERKSKIGELMQRLCQNKCKRHQNLRACQEACEDLEVLMRAPEAPSV